MAARPKKHRDISCEYYYSKTKCFHINSLGTSHTFLFLDVEHVGCFRPSKFKERRGSEQKGLFGNLTELGSKGPFNFKSI